ncbi:inactive pancreatic lipase-related protein 1-like [Glandiceps talaboti]
MGHCNLGGNFRTATSNTTMYTLLFTVAVCITGALAAQVCYDDLGCFTDDPPYDNTGSFPPQSPEEQDITFLLYTRQNRVTPNILTRKDVLGLAESNFDPSRPTKFVIHGYTGNGYNGWRRDMAQALVAREDVNAFSVDWRKGALAIYWQSAENTRVVGAELAVFMKLLQDQTGASYSDMHLIGHSLGAQVAGYAGEGTPGLGRISGLDPAGPFFEYMDPLVRLDPSDAEFVDAVHTDGNNVITLGFGAFQPVGDVDFYPNGGKSQPGCTEDEVDDSGTGCDHSRAHIYYMESITGDCLFTSYPCTLWEVDNDPSACSYCLFGQCSYMGYNADKSSSRGIFYLETGSVAPYCLN